MGVDYDIPDIEVKQLIRKARELDGTYKTLKSQEEKEIEKINKDWRKYTSNQEQQKQYQSKNIRFDKHLVGGGIHIQFTIPNIFGNYFTKNKNKEQ